MTRSRTVPVLLAALLLVGGLNVAAYAANGHPLLLGRSNHESSSATVHNTGPGPALRLQSRAGTPSLSVSSPAKVARLNADRIDGYEGVDLGVRAWTYRIGGDVGRGEVRKTFPGLPHGFYLVRYQVRGQVADPGGDFSCWFNVGSSGRALATTTTGTSVALDAWGEVDGRWALSFTCTSSGTFDISAGADGLASRITFIRLNGSSVGPATTTYP